MRRHLSGLIALAAFCGAASIEAATINVPADHATINAAVAAAGTSDTIVINNSATYAEFLRLDKKVTITAAVGQTPKISAATTTTLILNPGSQGSRFGSLAGGRITLECTHTAAADVATINTSSTTPVIFENVTMEGGGTGGNIVAINGVNTSVSFRNSTMDGKERAIRGTFASYGLGSMDGTVEFDHVRLKGATQFPIWNYAGTGGAWITTAVGCNYIIRNCELDSRTSVAPTRPTILFNRNSRPNLTMQDSIVWGGTGCFDAWWNQTAAAPFYDHLADTFRTAVGMIERCVFVQPVTASTTAYALIQHQMHSGFDYTIDHCDFINLEADAHTGVRMTAVYASSTNQAAAHRKVTVKNSNFFMGAGLGLSAVLTAGAPNDIFTSDYNNIFATGAAYTGVTPGTNDVNPGVDPGYTNAATGDVRYSNESLKRAGEGNTAIGTNASYADVIAGIVPGTPAINRAAHWSLMN